MKKDIDIIKHMDEDVFDIMSFTTNQNIISFSDSPLLRKAVCMSLINIGELTKSLSSSFKKEHSEIPWKNIAGLRDVTAHKYHTLNLDVIWAVATIEIPKLKKFIDEILSTLS